MLKSLQAWSNLDQALLEGLGKSFQGLKNGCQKFVSKLHPIPRKTLGGFERVLDTLTKSSEYLEGFVWDL